MARALLAEGQTIRALTRDLARAETLIADGARVVVGDMTDPLQMKRAFQGVGTAFLMGTPYAGGPETEWQQLETCIEAAQNADPRESRRLLLGAACE